MIIKNLTQVPFEVLIKRKIDLFICSSGYESRAIHLASKIVSAKVLNKVAFCFTNEFESFNRSSNDQFFIGNDFESINSDGDSEKKITEYLTKFFKKNVDIELNIVIDYSSMTRIWYSALLKYFFYYNFLGGAVNLFFCYSIAKYVSSPADETYNMHIGPIRGFTNITVPQKPTALIIGLGYEKNRAIGLNEYFDGETFVFTTDSSYEVLYSQEVKKNNKELLSSLKPENIYTYPLLDLNYSFSLLLSLM